MLRCPSCKIELKKGYKVDASCIRINRKKIYICLDCSEIEKKIEELKVPGSLSAIASFYERNLKDMGYSWYARPQKAPKNLEKELDTAST